MQPTRAHHAVSRHPTHAIAPLATTHARHGVHHHQPTVRGHHCDAHHHQPTVCGHHGIHSIVSRHGKARGLYSASCRLLPKRPPSTSEHVPNSSFTPCSAHHAPWTQRAPNEPRLAEQIGAHTCLTLLASPAPAPYHYAACMPAAHLTPRPTPTARKPPYRRIGRRCRTRWTPQSRWIRQNRRMAQSRRIRRSRRIRHSPTASTGPNPYRA